MPTKLNLVEFIQKSQKIHGNMYEYSKVKYINNRIKVEIKCKEHNIIFLQSPKNHLRGHLGCKECNKKQKQIKSSSTTGEFIKLAKNIHNNKYDYKNVSYMNNTTPIEIICKIHGSFLQRPNDHISKQAGCPKCGINDRAIKSTKTTKNFIIDAIEVHSDRYDYTKTIYSGCFEPIVAICREHGEFEIRATDHLAGSGCLSCSMSRGEWVIHNHLTENKIQFKPQQTFKDCVNEITGRRLKFDFYLQSKNVLIEFDGEQHFKPIRFNGISLGLAEKNYKKTQRYDIIKNKYAVDNNIPLLRIPYTEINNIEKIIKNYLHQS